jgi:hypothetical protein
MAKRWKCERCSTQNDEGVLTCSNCRMIRGAVVVPGSFSQSFEQAVPPDSPTAEVPIDSPTPAGSLPSWDALVDESTAATVSVPLWRRIPFGTILIVVIFSAGGIGALLFNAGRDSSGEINKGGDLEVTALRVGDCFDLKDPDAEELDTVTAVPCTTEHQYELFHVSEMPDGAYPSDAAMTAFAEENCLTAFGAYVGEAFDDSELDVAWVSPTVASWSMGDRTIQCAAYHPRIDRLTESVKKSDE